MHILIHCPQGGRYDAELTASIGAALQDIEGVKAKASLVALREEDADTARQLAPQIDVLESFEKFRARDKIEDLEAEVARLARDYSDVNWWSIAASERSIINSSFLIGGLGQRNETRDYVETLIVSMVRHIEGIVTSAQFDAVICSEADSLVSYVFLEVARHFNIKVLLMSPNAWIREDGLPGFFLCQDQYLHCDRMTNAYRELGTRALTAAEQERVTRFKRSVAGFDVKIEYRKITKSSFVVSAVSPNVRSFPQYLRTNVARNKNVEYYKVDIVAKARANMLRVWRRWRSRGLLGTAATDIPPRSVFYGLQYQPEQTTLVGGIFYANQVSVIENIAKALPFGYTLIVKEHPRGRGSRPAWQYSHLAHFPNVKFCDAAAKEIARRCEAVVTVTGTLGLEALVLDKPVFVLGHVYYDIADIVYKPKSWEELARMLRRVLVEGEYQSNTNRGAQIDRFFLAYLLARIPVLLHKDSSVDIAKAAITEFSRVHNSELRQTAQA